MQGPAFSTEQVLLTTLVVKLAAMAALATMLVRYRRFRHILSFERRGWPDRLIFVSVDHAHRNDAAVLVANRPRHNCAAGRFVRWQQLGHPSRCAAGAQSRDAVTER